MSSEIGPKAGGTLDNNTNRSLKVQGTITKESSPYYDHDEVCGDGVEILPHMSSRGEAQYAVEAYSRESQVDSIAGMKGTRWCA